ncbi:hypothetical protein RVR_2386 [Actinacidiphila reveromycinica]|uniref:DUF397 domain-containing protein n=1 Tax=Actinacidiphila reveromycinica TaxID=659352 RepID=A0A7U3VMS2_9ACTN|nr:DUF397 domain-containing protein [Streptomyces sp. SN-593]BBA96883.1 hypothetical protein RVR_2386 [Streptomyces sp. SN-593]
MNPNQKIELYATDLPNAKWRKSSFSNGGEQCVEVAQTRRGIAIRDSKDPNGPALLFTPAAFTEFLAKVNTRQFDS